MSRCSMMIAAALFAGSLYAQEGAVSISAETKQFYNGIKTNLMKAAEDMPASDFEFKPAGEERTYAQLLTHVAETQYGLCGYAKGEDKKVDTSSKTSKTDVEAVLKDSFTYCDSAYDSLTDANASEPVNFFRGKRTRLTVLNFNVIHDNEMYGQVAVYLRLKNMVPPSTAAAKARQQGNKK